MAANAFLLCTLLAFSSLSFHGIYSAVNYEVINEAPNHPGGIKYNNNVGIPYTKQIMGKINNFIWSTVFQQNSPQDRKPINLVILFIKDFKGADKGIEALSWGNNKINYSADVLQEYEVDEIKEGFTAVMYHEMTHVFQWDTEGAPTGLVEGIADYVLLKAGYKEGFPKYGEGDRWDQGYGFTARFLEYCDGITLGFVAKLNKMMRYKYEVKYFKDLTGKPVDQLWKEYKAKYKH